MQELRDMHNITYDTPFVMGQKIESYIYSLLHGELYDFLKSETSVRVFKGISREYTNKYMARFNKMLNINSNTTGSLDFPLKSLEHDDYVQEYIGFFVFQSGRGNAFGSFDTAYLFANKCYLNDHFLLGNPINTLAKFCNVEFGRVYVKDGKMLEKDIESVVYKDFYLELTSLLLDEID